MAVKARVRRGVVHAHSYGPFLRLADNVHARQDDRAEAGVRLESMAWFARMAATRLENDQRVFAGVEDQLREPVAALGVVFGQVLDCDVRIPGLMAQVAAVPALDVSRVGGAEQHLSAEAIATHRIREHQAALAAARSPLESLLGHQQGLVAQCWTLRAEIVEEFDLARSVSERMRQFYTRRISTYARGLRRSAADDLAFTLEPAPWTTQPCPWLPPGLDGRLNTPTTTTPAGADVSSYSLEEGAK